MNKESFVNSHVMKLRPYKPVSQESWFMDPSEWGQILKLDWNEATVGPAPEVKKAVINYVISNDFFHWYPATLNHELITLLSHFCSVPESNIQYFPSSDVLHEYIAKLYIESQDKVLILWPSYDNFRSTMEANGAEIVYSEYDPGFRFSLEKLKNDIKQASPKLVYLCNPNNPTGNLIELEELETLISEFPKSLFVVDEAYAEFAHKTSNQLALKYTNILITHTMSKAFALANMRFGYLVSSVSNIDAINRIRNPKNVTTVTQIAVMEALKNTDYMWRYVQEVELAKEWFTDAVQHGELGKYLHIYPSKANFLLVQCPNIAEKSRIYYALREKKIYVRQLIQSASLLSCLRITVGTLPQMKRVYQSLCSILLQE